MLNFREALEGNAQMLSYEQGKEEMLRLIMDLRRQGIRDSNVLAAIEKTPRDLFVEEAFASRSYEDAALPIACGQTISQPSIVGLMTQELEVNDRHRVLEIGTGSGYQTAILSHVCRMVYTIERHPELAQTAAIMFEHLRLKNIMRRCGDGAAGWSQAAPFDRILVTAAAVDVPQLLIDQLSEDNGIMVIPIGEESSSQTLTKIIKSGDQIIQKVIAPVRFVPLVEGEVS